jgi:hypothetical protein
LILLFLTVITGRSKCKLKRPSALFLRVILYYLCYFYGMESKNPPSNDTLRHNETLANVQPGSEEALIQNFLRVDHPNRGKLFSDLMSKMEEDQRDTGGKA